MKTLTKASWRFSAWRWPVVLGVGFVLALVGWSGTHFVRQVFQHRADAERIQSEARAYAEATGHSMEVSIAISELCMSPERLASLPASRLEQFARRYEDFQGADRLQVARYCVGLFLSSAIEEFDAKRLAIAQDAITSIITEYSNEPQIIGAAFGIASVLGLKNDPYLVDIASETIMDDDMPQGVRNFIMMTFLRTTTDTSHAPEG